MKLPFFVLFLQLLTYAHCDTDVHIGYKLTVAVPMAYSKGFIGRAFLMETSQMAPNFRAALSVEAIDEKYSCSLDVFLGDVKVWSSGHISRFYTRDRCVLELTREGDLKLKGRGKQIGWRAGTSGQGVERLNLLKNGNLVLVDGLNLIKWQSFNFPTDTMLWGQRLNVKTRLTSFPGNSTSFYSFEIQRDKIALYLNSGEWKYSYWEFKPSKERNITFLGLASKGLEVFDDRQKKIAQILSQTRLDPLRFLALENKTGNFGLYYFSAETGKFQASFQALNTTCDLPMACGPYGICTQSNACSCIRLVNRGHGLCSNGSVGISNGFCGQNRVKMIELQSVSSVLRPPSGKVNISKEVCARLCIDDCDCVAALYTKLKECFVYGEVRGVKQVERGSGMSYMVKVPKGTNGPQEKTSGLKEWVIVVIGVADGVIIFLVLGGTGYYFFRKRKMQT